MKTILLVALAAAAPVAAASPATPASLARLAEADANRDGKITRAEILAWRNTKFDEFDRNRDGALSDADIPPMLRRSAMALQLRQMRAQFDANGDGRVTRAEFVDGPTIVFDAADLNRDNVLTQAEIAAAQAKARNGQGR